MHCSVRYKKIEGGNRGVNPPHQTHNTEESSAAPEARHRSVHPHEAPVVPQRVRDQQRHAVSAHAVDKTRLDFKTGMSPSVSMGNQLRFDPATDTTITHWCRCAYSPGTGYPAPGPKNPWRSQPAWFRSPMSGPMDIPLKNHGDGFAPASMGNVHVPEGGAPGGASSTTAPKSSSTGTPYKEVEVRGLWREHPGASPGSCPPRRQVLVRVPL